MISEKAIEETLVNQNLMEPKQRGQPSTSMPQLMLGSAPPWMSSSDVFGTHWPPSYPIAIFRKPEPLSRTNSARAAIPSPAKPSRVVACNYTFIVCSVFRFHPIDSCTATLVPSRLTQPLTFVQFLAAGLDVPPPAELATNPSGCSKVGNPQAHLTL